MYRQSSQSSLLFLLNYYEHTRELRSGFDHKNECFVIYILKQQVMTMVYRLSTLQNLYSRSIFNSVTILKVLLMYAILNVQHFMMSVKPGLHFS